MSEPRQVRSLVPRPGAEGALEEASPGATTPAVSSAAAGDASPATDPFPREAWSTLLAHAAGYLRLTLALLKDPAVARHRRAALLAAAAYFASPVDLVPGIVPVLGQLDDLAVAMLAIRLALNALEPGRRQAHLAAAGLSDEALHEDLVAAGAIAAWTARAGARTSLRVGKATGRVLARGGRAAATRLAQGGRAAADRAGAVAGGAAGAAGGAPGAALDGARRIASAAVERAGTAAGGRVGEAAERAGATGRRLAARIRRRGTAEPDGTDGTAGTNEPAPPTGPEAPSDPS